MARNHKRNLAVLLNGRAKSVDEAIINKMAALVPQQDLYVSRDLKDSRRIVRTIVENRYRTVLTGGGDGTFATFATHLENHLDAEGIDDYIPRLGVLKLGTGNALASTFGAARIDNGSLERDLDYAANGARTRPMRFMEVEGKITPFTGLGLDALILNGYRLVREYTDHTPASPATEGLGGYALAIAGVGLPQYLTEKMPDAVIVNEGAPAWRVGPGGNRVGPMILEGEVIHRGPIRLVCMGRVPFYGFDFKLFPYAMSREDRFHLRVTEIGMAEAITHLPSIWQGKHSSRSVNDFLAEKVSVHLSEPSAFQIGGDGEGYRSYLNVNLRARPYDIIDFRHLAPMRPNPLEKPLRLVQNAVRSSVSL